MSRNNNIPLDDLEGEIWLPIKGYESYYEVSNMGRIKSKGRIHQMPNTGTKYYPDLIMAHGLTIGGYEYVNLRKDKRSKTRTVHRIVAMHFVKNPNPKVYKIVDHKKGNKRDNRASELEWTTSAINNQRAYDLGLKKGSMIGRKGANSPFSKRILQLSRNWEVCFAIYESTTIASEKTGISQPCINSAAVGRQEHAGKFRWERA